MAKKEYLSPIDKNPYLVITKEDGSVVYRDQSTGQDFDEAYVKANGITRDDLPKGELTEADQAAADAEAEAKAKAKADKGPSGPSGASGASGASGSGASGSGSE